MFGSRSRELVELKAIISGIGRSLAMIEFKMDGLILTANENFLAALGYTLPEIQGQHHRMFVDPAERNSAAYREFWEALNRGEFQTAEYKRIGKGGKHVWIQASYIPVKGADGSLFKVIKFATDVTERTPSIWCAIRSSSCDFAFVYSSVDPGGVCRTA